MLEVLLDGRIELTWFVLERLDALTVLSPGSCTGGLPLLLPSGPCLEVQICWGSSAANRY